MRCFFLLLLVIGSYYSAQAQWGTEWRGYTASNNGNDFCRLFITGETLWYTNFRVGVEKYTISSGVQELSTTYPITYITEDHNQQPWALGLNNQVYTYQQNQWQPFAVPDSVRNKLTPSGNTSFHTFLSMAFDSSNTLWIAAEHYIWRYDGQTWTSYDRISLNVGNVEHVSVDQNNTVWFNSRALSIISFDGTTWTNYGTNDFGITTDYGTDKAYIDAGNKKWWGLSCSPLSSYCADSNLFLVYNDTTWNVLTQGDLNTTRSSIGRIEGNGKEFWTSAGNPLSLVHYDGTTWNFYETANYGMPSIFPYLAVDTSNNVWRQNYLKVFSFDGAVTNDFKIGVNSDWSYNQELVSSSDGAMWWLNGEIGKVNFDRSTIEAIDDLEFNIVPTFNGFAVKKKYYSHIVDLAPNNVWVSNTGEYDLIPGLIRPDTLSLFHYDGSAWTETKVDTQVAPYATRVLDMAVYNNNVWLATPSQGLLNWNGAIWTGSYPAPLDGMIEQVITTNTGTLWLSADNQIFEYDGTTVTTYDHTTTTMPDAAITALHYDNTTNTLWATTDSAGLAQYNNNSWTTYTTQNSGLSSNHLLALTQGQTGDLWIGTKDSGVVYYDGNNTWKVINTNTPNSPMISNEVSTLEVDNNNNVWFFNDQLLFVYQEGGLVNIQELPNSATTVNTTSYPNPFTHSTLIQYVLDKPSKITLHIYDLQGKTIDVLSQDQVQWKGVQQIEWQPSNLLPSGIYIYSIVAEEKNIGYGKLFYQSE